MLDITAFSNALLAGTVSYTRSLGATVGRDRTGRVRVYAGDDAVVYPLERGGTSMYALRVPLRADSARSWPERYADLQAESGGIHRFLPKDLTILDSDVVGEPPLALLYRWIPGNNLADVIRAGSSDSRLDMLIDGLADLAEELRRSGLVHGDIAPGNLIVRPDATIALIDLDRMGPAHHQQAIPRRRPGYRLSDANASGEAEDAFALLVLLTSVAAISGIGDVPKDSEPDRGAHPPLVFSSWDLMDPRRSELVQHLESELSGVPALLLDYLIGACTAPSEHVPKILAEAIHDVQRAPRRTQPQATAETSWEAQHDVVEVDNSRSQERMYESWGEGPWSPSPIDGPGESFRSGPQSTAGTDELLERISGLASLARPASSARERHRLRAGSRRDQVARELREALATNNRAVLVRLAMSGDIAELGDSERSDLVMVLRALSYDQIARAVASDQDATIVAAIDPQIFAADTDIDEAFRGRVLLARERDEWVSEVIESVQHGSHDRCIELVTVAPEGGMDRLPPGIRERLQRLTGVSTLVLHLRRALDQRNVNAIVGPMARLSALTGNWSAYVDADEVVAAVGYPRIRQRVIDLVAAGPLAREDQWLVDCVVAVGDVDNVARAAGKSRDELERLLAPPNSRHPETVARAERPRNAG